MPGAHDLDLPPSSGRTLRELLSRPDGTLPPYRELIRVVHMHRENLLKALDNPASLRLGDLFRISQEYGIPVEQIAADLVAQIEAAAPEIQP